MPTLLNDRYELGKQLGSGGMASVYEANDTALGRLVAVKVLHPRHEDDPTAVARFDREARAIAALNHPGVVSVFDVGREGASRPYIVMECVTGDSVKQLVAGGPLSIDKIIDVGVQVASALDYVHRAGILHRDIKSQNIVVGKGGAAKLVDFGIAVPASDDHISDSNGSVLGTVHYIAPERVRGQAASHSSDLYSLGIVLYEMATGHLPFVGSDPIAVATQHVNELPPHPGSLNPTIPASLDRIILALLQKDPAARPASAAEVVRALLAVDPDSTTRLESFQAQTTAHVPPPRAVIEPPARPRPPQARVATASATWPIAVLAFLAFGLVLGLFPLWSAVLQIMRG